MQCRNIRIRCLPIFQKEKWVSKNIEIHIMIFEIQLIKYRKRK